ncbi:MAG: hypothetical protein OXE77_11470 [Flavobacteriaceae bacterium]|nr:hypothetical protein [Flavobacteriaceae bacterium]MCY4297954.1 hypothetical protein [Flavobacteriaceae bacterium]
MKEKNRKFMYGAINTNQTSQVHTTNELLEKILDEVERNRINTSIITTIVVIALYMSLDFGGNYLFSQLNAIYSTKSI